MRINPEDLEVLRAAADTLALEEHRYVERFGGDCPNGPKDPDGKPATLEDGSVVQHGDRECELCEGTGTIEDESAPWIDPMINTLRRLADDLEQYVPEPRILPAYSADAACCAKCGNTGAMEPGVSTHFGMVPTPEQMRRNTPQGVFLVFGENGPHMHHDDEPPAPKLPGWMEGTMPEQEFLARVCQRCGFTWLEACLDDPYIALSRMEG